MSPPTDQLVEVPAFDRVRDLVVAGQLERARDRALAALAAAPDDPDAHGALALVLFAEHAHAEGLAAVEQALRLAPDWPFAHRLRGMLLVPLGRYAEAELALLKAIELNPSDDVACAAYARLLWLLDHNAEALAWVDHALSLDPTDTDLHATRARILLDVPTSAWGASEASARAALALDPENVDAQAVLGTSLIGARRYDEAERHLRAALGRDPHHALALHGLATLTMAQFPLYRPLLVPSLFLRRLAPSAQLGVLFGLWALYRTGSTALRAQGFEEAASVALALYLSFCAWTWFAEPVTRWLLERRHPWLRDVA